ncbi:MAG: tetratricopeptide repeat protein [Spirochaetaceae bacterium]|nr:MAG: tetratricopeptide repeat protein [Spirochaetaceae bacterium]
MEYLSNRFGSSSSGGSGSPRRWLVSLVAMVILLSAVSVTYFFTDGFGILPHVNTPRELSGLWHNGDYEQVITYAHQLLDQTPMQATPLMFAGFGHFYRGMQQVDDERRTEDLDRAVRMLRKVLLIPQPARRAEVHYVLAKAYFHLGEFYYDVSVEHMNRAIELGFEGQDSFEYLALAYDGLNMYAESVESYQRAIAINPGDLLYAGLAETYMRNERYAEAGRYFQLAIEASEDSYLVQRSRRNLGHVYLETGRYEAARQQFRAILEGNPYSADAHYALGRAYLLSGDPERARFEWREAIRLEPRHEAALRGLRGN